MALPTNKAEFGEWTPRWYYVMQNKTSGIKYLGQTIQDIQKYLGSGVYWKKHCKKYGGYTRENIDVIEVVWCKTKQQAEAWLEKKSSLKYWIVEDYANQVPENTDENPFYGPYVNQMRMRTGTHPWSKENKTLEIEGAQSATRFGTERFKKAIIEKYGVDNVAKVPEIAMKRAEKQKVTKRLRGTARGGNNANARPVTINGLTFSTMKEASKYFNISLHYVRKLKNEFGSVFRVDISELNERTEKYGTSNQ